MYLHSVISKGFRINKKHKRQTFYSEVRLVNVSSSKVSLTANKIFMLV